MRPPTIGILGSKLSREAQRIRHELRRRGATPLMADLSGFPAVQKAQLDQDGATVGRIRLGDASVWLVRQLEVPFRFRPDLGRQEMGDLRRDPGEALSFDRETRAFVQSLVWSLADMATVINQPQAIELHSKKALLTGLLARAGIPVPRTLTTTDRAAAEAFVEELSGRAVCKAGAGGGEARLASEVLREQAPRTGLDGPLVFQERIVGPSLRAYLVEDRLVSCCQVIHGDVVDWRADQRGIEPWSKDPALERAVCEIAAATGMDYCGVDVEVDEFTGPHVIDVNPCPLFASYETGCGHDVAGPIAELLLSRARG